MAATKKKSASASKTKSAPDPKALGKKLMDAAMEGDLEKLVDLLSRGADVNYGTREAVTVLHLACETAGDTKNYPDGVAIVQTLVKAGADPHAKDKHGWTPIMYASKNQEAIAKILGVEVPPQ